MLMPLFASMPGITDGETSPFQQALLCCTEVPHKISSVIVQEEKNSPYRNLTGPINYFATTRMPLLCALAMLHCIFALFQL